MKQPKWQAPKSRETWIFVLGLCAVVALIVTIASKPSALFSSDFPFDHLPIWGAVSASVFGVLGVLLLLMVIRHDTTTLEDQARQRVRQAEDKLSDELRSSATTVADRGHLRGGQWIDSYGRLVKVPGPISVDEDEVDGEVPEDAQASTKLRDDRLTLAALWDVTHGRLDLYHQIVTRQARRSFGAAQVAMAIGFVLLVVFAGLAVQAKTTTGAISVGSLGAVGAAFAAYIGKTFVRSQESAASHLRAYFDQPLELSRYLAAERLLADATDLSADQHAAILSTLVQSIATAGHQDDKAKGSRPRGRQARSKPE